MKIARTIGALVGAALIALAAGDARAEGEVAYQTKDDAIPKALTDKPGDAANGRKMAANRKKGGCLACHVMPIPEEQFHGQIGPSLYGVANRLSEGQIRLRVVNPKLANPDTIMPAFHRTKGLHRVLKKWEGKTFLSAQEVEDMVAYLMTLNKDQQ